ncbi:hypothetical protein PENSPDRAFT_753888 [Peniophora sp. CONT]|nr:hypothetical protein PENSPDRAFT_753888 [Peniophora sp. CONT]
MLFTKNLSSFASVMVMASTLLLSASAIPTGQNDVPFESEFLTWLSTTNANVTYVGPKPGSLAARAGGTVNVVYCTERHGNVCGGSCTVYNGPNTCLSGGISCLKASSDVSFCDHGNCHGSCNELSTCGTKLDNGFCDTPGTKSITVPFI